MKDLNLEDLKQLLLDGRRAAQYAWDHYDELAAREAVYTLYGPLAYYTGAAIPGNFTPKNARKLTLETRRTDYLIYELDSEYKLLRVKYVLNSVQYDTYHWFELDGIQYGCPFQCKGKMGIPDDVVAVAYKDGKPYFSALLSDCVVTARFFEYVSQEKALITEYSYHPFFEHSFYGYPTDPNAPINALNSAATRVSWEEKPMYTDFSQFFKGSETAEWEEEKVINKPVSNWIDDILNTDIPDNVVAFCFNLYDDGCGEWSMELIGSSRFDLKDEDWPCDEITHFDSRKNLYKWEMECSWEEALAYIVNGLKEYLANGKYADVLKSRSGVGVGFVDGSLEILYSRTDS